MGDKIFSVGQAAEWLAKPGEARDAVARQLRHYRRRGFVRSRGTFGAGPTATNVFNPVDLGVAKLCRALTAIGIKDEQVMQAVGEASYDLPSSDHASGAMPGLEAALARPHAPWSLYVFLSEQADGTYRVFAQVRLIERDGHPDHPAIDAAIEVPMRWLPALAELAHGAD